MKDEERKRIKIFLRETEKQIKELDAKKFLTRGEQYLLDACRGDVKRSKKALGISK